MLMEEQLRQLLDKLPERRPRSRLDQYRELIMEMRKRRYSYREISRFLGERCGVGISHNAVRNFINRHCFELAKAEPAQVSNRQRSPDSNAVHTDLPEALAAERPQAVRERIDALKRRSQARENPGPGFRFDPAQPLRLPDD